jgi:hypothetical protein
LASLSVPLQPVEASPGSSRKPNRLTKPCREAAENQIGLRSLAGKQLKTAVIENVLLVKEFEAESVSDSFKGRRSGASEVSISFSARRNKTSEVLAASREGLVNPLGIFLLAGKAVRPSSMELQRLAQARMSTWLPEA